MFNNNFEEKTFEIEADKNSQLKPVGLFSEHELRQIVCMINFLSYGQWMFVRDEKSLLNTHFKLGVGVLTIDTIAKVTSSGALINIAGPTLRVFRIDMDLLKKTYDAEQGQIKNNLKIGLFQQYENKLDLTKVLFTPEILELQQTQLLASVPSTEKDRCVLM